MQLNFEVTKDVGTGAFPDVIHFANTQAQILSITGGELFGHPTNKIDNGAWENATLESKVDVSPDTNISNFEVKMLSGFGIIGSYRSGNTHKLIIYEFAFEMDRYLSSGSIKHTIDNPISSFDLSLENPLSEDPEQPGNVAISENNSLVSPGAKILFEFSAGNSEAFELGTFYVDRSNFRLLSETSSVDGRNLIGKALKDQTLDENYIFEIDYLHLTIENILQNANLTSDQYLIETTGQRNSFQLERTTDVLTALEEILKATADWKIEELVDGTIVIGSPTYVNFVSQGTYSFYRNKDIFSRDITRDDIESYRRVCVHDSEFSIAIYRDVKSYTGWNLQANKTLYVQVADGIKTADATAYAEELALRLEDVGKVESFNGPFRPHLMPGDQAVIINENQYDTLGLITEVTHKFGKNGYYTNFTVDSGGQIGKGRLSDYINKVTKEPGTTNIGYEE